MKPTVKIVLQYVGIFLLVIFTWSNASAEQMEPSPSKDSVNTLIAQIYKVKPDKNLVSNLLVIARYFLYNGDKACEGYINSALSLSEKLSDNDGLIRSMCLKAAFLKNIKSDACSADKILAQAISLSRKLRLTESEAYAYYTKALWFNLAIDRNTEFSEEYCTKARNLYKSSGNMINEAYMVKCLADYYYNHFKLGESLKELLVVLELYKKADYQFLHHTYYLIGTVYNAMGNYSEALKYGLLTIKSAEQNKVEDDICLFYFFVGQVFMSLKQQTDALAYFSYVLEKTDSHGTGFYTKRIVAYIISTILIKKGKPEEAIQLYKKTMAEDPVDIESVQYSMDEYYLGGIYSLLKQYDKAEKLFLHMQTHAQEDPYFHLLTLFALGKFYIGQGKFEKAREYVDKARVHKFVKSRTDSIVLSLQQFQVDSASGNYLSAIRHYQIYKGLNDSMFNEKKSNQIASISIQYETEEKEQKINILTAENREQKAVLEKRVFERNVFTAGAIMLLLLLLLSINRYKIKQRANKQLQEQQEVINKKNEILNCLLEEKEELLESKDKLIQEKEWLIKEVHHRVKNNLQMISTLLYSQSTYLRDDAALAAINESQQRIHAISLIHQKLYQSDNLQLVNMKSYVHELVDYLKESLDTKQDVEFNVEIDAFEMGVSKAIPLGLILNEAITNSLKYAFTKDKRKIISILLLHKEDETTLLLIKDNGKGMPADFDPLQSDSLGINLMQGLSSQINAEFSIKNENGTIISLEFKDMDELILE